VKTTRRIVVGLAALAMPLAALAHTSPAAAENPVPVDLSVSVAASSGSDRICLGVNDPDGQSATWVCSPEAQWYAEVVTMVLSYRPI